MHPMDESLMEFQFRTLSGCCIRPWPRPHQWGSLFSSSVTELSLVSLDASGSSWTKGRIELARLLIPSFWLEFALAVMVDEICRKKIALTMWYKFIMHYAANANGTSLVNDNCELLH